MVRFSLFGIPVNIEPFFWVVLAFLGGGYQALMSGNSDALLAVGLFVLAGFISILIHEMGHALMIKKYGLQTEITLTTFGGYASYPAGILSRKQSFLVTAAGPALQLAFGSAIYYGILTQFQMPTKHVEIFVFYLFIVSIFWALFNCLPIFPLDGGQMLSAVLGPRRAKLLYIIGMLVAVVAGVYCYLQFKSFLIPLFMALFVYQNYQLYQRESY